MSTRSINNKRTQAKFGTGPATKSNPKDKKDKKGKKDEAEEETGSSAYYSGRRSGASAKPTREKSAGVTVIPSSSAARYKKASTTSQADLTKEERKRQRKELRDHEDQVNAVAEALAKADPEYDRMRRVWARMLGVGFVSILIAFATQLASRMMDNNDIMLIISGVTMVFSYVCIIGALVYDMFKINRVFKKYQAQAASMSDKRLREALNLESQRVGAERAEEQGTTKGKIKNFFK